jgi:DNA-binding beta-propeller fold protein YncE
MAHGNGHHAGGHCVECSVPQLARNHYFTGKLLVERDFTDEQRYHIGKQRRHNQRLHGRGTVCGLQVKEHPNAACRNQYVVIEPGMAIDCCGREIIVPREEYWDFRTQAEANWRRMHENEPFDAAAHTLQICVRYRECDGEPVPALFDECTCDDDACRPNRILESYDFDVLIDPDRHSHDPDGVRLAWEHTLAVAHPHRVAVDEEHDRVYVLTENPAFLYVFETEHHTLLGSHSVASPAMDLALSGDGARAYVAAGQNDAVVVLDTAALGNPAAELNRLPHGGGTLSLAVSPSDGTLYVLDAAARQITAWSTAINTAGADLGTARLGQVGVGNGPSGLAVAPDGGRVFVANSGDATISVISAPPALAVAATIALAGSAPGPLAIAARMDGAVRLFVGDTTNKTLRVLEVPPALPGPYPVLGDPCPVAEGPVDLLALPGSRWLYTLGEDANGRGVLRAVDTHRIEHRQPDTVGEPLAIGDVPRHLAPANRGRRLYAAYQGKPEPGTGGVAVVDVAEESCADILLRTLEPCPDCDEGDCIVLATITDYRHGQDVLQRHIDNLADRHLLPSTDTLTDVVRCLLERGGGGEGEPGEQGPPGPGIDAVQATSIPCTQEPAPATIQVINGKRTLVLEVPRGCDAPEPPKPPVLSHICAISWTHDGPLLVTEGEREGLILAVAVDRPVRAGDFTDQTFIVLREQRSEDGVSCWCEVPGARRTGDFTPPCQIDLRRFQQISADDAPVNGVIFQFKELRFGRYRVVIKGDFIRSRDEQNQFRGLDANHLPPWLPGRPSGDGVEGGTFESWFTVLPRRTNINLATGAVLMEELGLERDVARAIERRARRQPFTSIDELASITGLTPERLETLRPFLTTGEP